MENGVPMGIFCMVIQAWKLNDFRIFYYFFKTSSHQTMLYQGDTRRKHLKDENNSGVLKVGIDIPLKQSTCGLQDGRKRVPGVHKEMKLRGIKLLENRLFVEVVLCRISCRMNPEQHCAAIVCAG